MDSMLILRGLETWNMFPVHDCMPKENEWIYSMNRYELAYKSFYEARNKYPNQKCKLVINDLIVREWHPHV